MFEKKNVETYTNENATDLALNTARLSTGWLINTKFISFFQCIKEKIITEPV